MLDDVKTLPATAPASEARELLASENVRDVLVVDRAGRLLRLVDAPPAGDGAVGEAAGPAPMGVPLDADADETLARMQVDGLRRLTVVDAAGRPVGILARARLEHQLDHERRRGR